MMRSIKWMVLFLSGALFIIVLFSPSRSTGQNKVPVSWRFFAQHEKGDTFNLHLTAAIEPGWHIYSQSSQGGPGPINFNFQKNHYYKAIGGIREIGELKTVRESLFDAVVKEYSTRVDFVQRIICRRDSLPPIKGIVKFIACNGTVCLPPREQEFSIGLGGGIPADRALSK